MKSRWSDEDARAAVVQWKRAGEDLALRVYTSRLLGAEPDLVIHGGGNTSVKTKLPDFLGHEREVICVKGSGWDLAAIEPPGLPVLHLAPLREVRAWDALSDEDMVRFLRANLLDPNAPTPSVETLLHAFLPHRFVDHSHAAAVLAVSDQPDGIARCRDLYGDRVAIVPYVMPGFGLAKAVADAHEAAPEAEGVLLHKHGLFTFGDTARESYERTIDFVTRAEEAIARAPKRTLKARSAAAPQLSAADVAPIVRGACADDLGDARFDRRVAVFRTSAAIRDFVDGADAASYGARGVITPDHIIRTKNEYLIAPSAESGLAAYDERLRALVADYRVRYDAYFAANNARVGGIKRKLDSAPRVVLAPGVGLFGLGRTAKDAAIAADLAEITLRTVSDAERLGRFEPLGHEDLFDMEYWSLEQAKLGAAKPKPLAGQAALVTGGGGTIGAATAALFAANGAEVAILDIDGAAAERTRAMVGGAALAIACDVTDEAAVTGAFDRACLAFGGVDIVVSNAGAAVESPVAELDEALLRGSFELNFFAHQRVAKAAVSVMRRQGTGGALLFNLSKQAINPGENFGAYGLPKAATLFLMRQYALEVGRYGIRANGVNADRIRSGLLTDDLIARRAQARGLDEERYMTGNLLGVEVFAEDVAQAFLHHALALKTTGDVTTVDGGNVAAMLR